MIRAIKRISIFSMVCMALCLVGAIVEYHIGVGSHTTASLLGYLLIVLFYPVAHIAAVVNAIIMIAGYVIQMHRKTDEKWAPLFVAVSVLLSIVFMICDHVYLAWWFHVLIHI